MSPRAFAFDSQGPSVGGDFSKWWGFCSTPSYPKAFSFLKRTILFPSILLLPYMDTWECVFTSDLPTTQLVLDNYNSWLAISWKQQIPCLAQHPPPKAPLSHCLWHPQFTILNPFYLLLSSTTLILSEQDVLPCIWQDLLQSHATKTQHSFQIQKVGFITAF